MLAKIDGNALLSYSTNVHALGAPEDLFRVLTGDVAAVRGHLQWSGPFGVELHTNAATLQYLLTPGAIERLHATLAEHDLFVFSLNAFPLSDFHAPSVKDEVYRPDWSRLRRVHCTLTAGKVLAGLLNEGCEGSISTSPGSFKPWGDSPDLHARIARNLAHVMLAFHELREYTGRTIRLAFEPEPCCTFETVDEIIRFYQDYVLRDTVAEMKAEWGLKWSQAHEAVRRHFGVTLDACHLAVACDDPAAALAELDRADLSVAKVHISAAARLEDPGRNPEGLAQLEKLNEPQYLHQTFARDSRGQIAFRGVDLPDFLSLTREQMLDFTEVRSHFHMPLFHSRDAALGTTAAETEALLEAIRQRPDAIQVVNETYTWPVLARKDESVDIHANIARELSWTRSRLEGEC